MNEAQQTELIASLKAVRTGITLLLNHLQDGLQTVTAPPVDEDDPKLHRLTYLAKKKVARANGEWVSWNDLRPAYRDRDRYAESVWRVLSADCEVETRTSLVHNGVRREVRYEPLI